MIGLVFAGITLSAAILATFLTHLKHAILALWVAGLGVGAVYLTLGAEFLAIIQCMVSTLVTISFIFFSVMFGEYQSTRKDKARSTILLTVFSVGLGAAFAGVIFLGAQDLPEVGLVEVSATDLADLGRALTQHHLLALEVLGLTLFLVLVGGGVVARFERSGPS